MSYKIRITYVDKPDKIIDLGNDFVEASKKQTKYVLMAKRIRSIKSITWEN